MILALNHSVWKLRLTPDILAIAIFPESPTGTMFRPAIFRINCDLCVMGIFNIMVEKPPLGNDPIFTI